MKTTIAILCFLLLCPILGIAVTNMVVLCEFLDDTGFATVLCLDCNPLWITNLTYSVRSGDVDDPASNRVTVWQSDGIGLGAAGDICYKRNDGGTVSSGLVAFVESTSLLSVTQTWYSSNLAITNVQTYISGSLISWTTNGVGLP